jgi:hypothetical protein
MSQVGERRVVLYPSTAVAAGTVADTKPTDVAGYTAAILILDVSAISTGTTLDVYVQQEIPIAGAADTWGQVPTGAAVWDDVAHFTQVTTGTGTWIRQRGRRGKRSRREKRCCLSRRHGSQWPDRF